MSITSVELSKQKLALDEAARGLKIKISELNSQWAILMRAMYACDEGENILESNTILASEARKIMKELSKQK